MRFVLLCLLCGCSLSFGDYAVLDASVDGPSAEASTPDAGDSDGRSPDSGRDSGRDASVALALSDVELDRGTLVPVFDATTMAYDAQVGVLIASVRVRATTETVGATISINGVEVESGSFSAAIPLAVGSNTIALVVRTEDSMVPYSVNVERASPGIYLKSSNTQAEDAFGVAVSLSGDTLVVGAPGEDSAATGIDGDQEDNAAADSGAVYVFRNTAGRWAQEAYLKASDPGAGSAFGTSTDIDGDVLIVGAPGRGDWRGAAYVFRRAGTRWAQEAILEHPSADPGDAAGFAVSISGNVAVLGAHGESSASSGVGGDATDNTLEGSGAVVVFRFAAGWSQEAFIKASNPDAIDRFGFALELDNDTLIVGALTEDSDARDVDRDGSNNDAADSGAAYVFHNDGSTWSQQAYLKASNAGSDDQFGVDVSVEGDWAVVGAYFEDSSGTGVNGDGSNDDEPSAGAAYIYRRSSGGWTFHSFVKASNTRAGDRFGWRVALEEDLLAVSATYEDSSGAAYVFRWNGSSWAQFQHLKAAPTDAEDTFGFSLALDDARLVVGASGEASSALGIGGDGALNDASAAGAAYVY